MPERQDQVHRLDSTIERIDAMQRHVDRIERSLGRDESLSTLGLLSAMVAHELNRLLTPVRTYAELALASPNDRELTRKALEHAAGNAARAGGIIESVLSLADEPGRPAGDEGEHSCVAEVVSDALGLLPVDPEEAGIELTIDIAESCEAAISPTALEQVVVNLATNAVAAMRSGPGSLTIRGSMRAGASDAQDDEQRGCSTWNTPDRTVVLEVIDTGVGMSPAAAERIFEPFSSGSQAGFGLGLPLSRRLIERVGGSIEVRSRPGVGTRFTVMLPAANTDNQASGSHH